MAIARWRPSNDLASLHHTMDRLFSDVFGDSFAGRGEGEGLMAPTYYLPVDIKETENGYLVEAPVPGFKPEDVEVTHPDKVLYPDDGYTKADVAAYYRAVAPRLLPFLKDRPVTLERLPDGLGEGKPHFWQKNTPESYPAWIPREVAHFPPAGLTGTYRRLSGTFRRDFGRVSAAPESDGSRLLTRQQRRDLTRIMGGAPSLDRALVDVRRLNLDRNTGRTQNFKPDRAPGSQQQRLLEKPQCHHSKTGWRRRSSGSAGEGRCSPPSGRRDSHI